MNMADVCAREKIAREIEKTSESIRKKHRSLKTGRIEEDMALDWQFKPIIKPLQKIVYNLVRAIKRQSHDNNATSASKRKRKEAKEEEEEGEKVRRSNVPRPRVNPMIDRVQPITSIPRSKIVPTIESWDNVFETTEGSLATKVQNQLQTSEDREALQIGLGPLGQKYVETILKGTRDKQKRCRLCVRYLPTQGWIDVWQ